MMSPAPFLSSQMASSGSEMTAPVGMPGIEIFVDRGNGFEFLAFDTTPNYVDEYAIEPGQTAVWKYKAVYIKDSKLVGQFSEVVQITVTGEVRA